MISKYMVLIASEQKLLMMRPYQIYAVKAIVDCIDQNCGNGYVWHTTGSGKTLTSFKASTLLKTNESIHASALNPGQTLTKQAVAQAILDKHDAATGDRRFNALLATASINDAIEYHEVFKQLQVDRQAADPEFVHLKPTI